MEVVGEKTVMGISKFFSIYIKIFYIIISFHLWPLEARWIYWGYKKNRYNKNYFYNFGFGRIALISVQKINMEKEMYKLNQSHLKGKIT